MPHNPEKLDENPLHVMHLVTKYDRKRERGEQLLRQLLVLGGLPDLCPRPSRGYPGSFNRRSCDNNPQNTTNGYAHFVSLRS